MKKKTKANMDIGEERPLFSREEVEKNVAVEWLVFEKDYDGSIKLFHNTRDKTEALRVAKDLSDKYGECFYVMSATAICMSGFSE